MIAEIGGGLMVIEGTTAELQVLPSSHCLPLVESAQSFSFKWLVFFGVKSLASC